MHTAALCTGLASLLSLAAARRAGKATIIHQNETAIEYKHFDCGTHAGHGSAAFNRSLAVLHSHEKAQKRFFKVPGAMTHKPKASQKQAQINVDAVFHVVTKQASAGSITPQMVQDQVTAMNTAYNPYGVNFNLVNTTWTVNDLWAVAAGSDMDAVKAALRQGTYSTLNLYFHTDLAGNILGTCTLPNTVPAGADPTLYVSDGCNVNANTMPGGIVLGYNQGMTAVHETGHWLGLLHTFEGYSCTGDGDSILDTPKRAPAPTVARASPPRTAVPASSASIPSTITWITAPTLATPASPRASSRGSWICGPSTAKVTEAAGSLGNSFFPHVQETPFSL
ncbi:hypothetical protein H2203_001291 [Taxawa tesnikishii (nom. ined.)]|nr:hypothetical protein H2203_001291 [Dothideales sp. JES 119]